MVDNIRIYCMWMQVCCVNSARRKICVCIAYIQYIYIYISLAHTQQNDRIKQMLYDINITRFHAHINVQFNVYIRLIYRKELLATLKVWSRSFVCNQISVVLRIFLYIVQKVSSQILFKATFVTYFFHFVSVWVLVLFGISAERSSNGMTVVDTPFSHNGICIFELVQCEVRQHGWQTGYAIE